jgi:hypothetical protein
MPQIIPFIPLIASGVSALGGALANRKSTSTSTPTVAPEYAGLQGDLIKQITERMSNPGAGVEPLRLGLMEGVNRRFKTLPGKLTTSLAQRGFAKSGQLGAGFKGLELARMGEQGDIATRMAELELNRGDQGLDMATRLLGLGTGQTATQSGNMLGGGIGAGSETLTTLLMLDKLLKGSAPGGGVGGPGFDFGSYGVDSTFGGYGG